MLFIKNESHLLFVLNRLKNNHKGFGLSVNEQVVLLYLADKVGYDWYCNPPIKQIAEDTNQGERTVHRAITKLSEIGFIDYKTGTHGRSNLYKINIETIGAKFNYPMRYITDVKTISDAHRANQADKSIWDDDE